MMQAGGHREEANRKAPRQVVSSRAVSAGLGLLAGVLVLAGIFAGMGGPHHWSEGLSRVLTLIVLAGWAPAFYLLGAIGLGRVFGALIRTSSQRCGLQAAMGLGLMLTLSHLLGTLGLLTGGMGKGLSAALTGGGLGLLLHQLWVERRSVQCSRGWWWLAGLPAAVLLLVAACNPPGALWNSEGRGYDALSYHLPLAQEWLALGRVRPLEHNVYSFLPSYVEAAFYHLAVMRGEPLTETPESTAWGLLAEEGHGVIACQLLSAGISLLGAWMVAAASRVVLERADIPERMGCAAASFAGALVLATPWVLVTGSLAYNDMAVVMLGAGAMLAAADVRLRPVQRGILSAFLMGAACGAKPTALFLMGPAVGVMLLGSMPPRRWFWSVSAGVIVGLAMLAPWLVRNWVYSGNPVFPMATGLFGSGHWSAEQVARYASGHQFSGSWVERLRLMVLPDASDPIGRVHRGLLHPQWFALFPLAAAAMMAALAARRLRGIAILLAGGLVLQLAAWLVLTHIQSRFLLPMAVTGGMLGALGIALVGHRRGIVVMSVIGVAAAALQTGGSLRVFARESGGQPNQLLGFGPGLFTGELFRDRAADAGAMADPEPFEHVWPQLYVNFSVPPEAKVYLLGDARPLYFTGSVVYNTTWDRWPLAEAMRAAPGDPEAQLAALRERGITHVLVNFGEIERLSRSGESGWTDPLISAEGIMKLFETHARRIRSWPETGEVLYAIRANGKAARNRNMEGPTGRLMGAESGAARK